MPSLPRGAHVVLVSGAILLLGSGIFLLERHPSLNGAPVPHVDGPFQARLDRGKDLVYAGSYDEAEDLLRSVAEEAAEADAHAARAEALTWLANVARRTARYDEARAFGEEALALGQAHDLRAQMPRTYIALGLLAWLEYRLADAEELLTRALELAREDGNEPAIAAATGNLGLAHADLGEFEEARADFHLFLEMGRRLDSLRYVGNALTNLGMVATNSGRPADAVPNLLDALETYRAISDPSGELKALGILSTAYQGLGRPADAFAALDSALSLARRLGDPREEALNLRDLGVLHHTAGEPVRALERLGQAVAIFEELGWGYELGQVHRWMALVHLELGSVDEALERARRALELHESAVAPMETLDDRVVLAEVEGRRGRMREAREHAREAGELARRIDVPAARVAAALARARLASRAGDHGGTLAVLADVKAELDAVGPVDAAEALALEARALRLTGRPGEAAGAALEAVEAVERVRGRFGSGALRTSFLAGRTEVYGERVHALLDAGRTAEAFEESDRARGRALLDHATATEAGAGATSLTRIGEARALLSRIDAIVAQLDRQVEVGADPRTVEHLRAELRETRSEYESLMREAAERDAAGSAILGVGPVPAVDVRGALRPRELLLEYFVGPERTVVFAARHDTVIAFRLAGGEQDLASRVRVARDLLADSTATEDVLRPVLGGLYERLLAPVADAGLLSEVETLVVVPHSVLGYLPFAALHDRRSGRYLIEDVWISYAPSAGALAMLRERDAAVEGGPERASVFAPFPDELPASAVEAVRISDVLPGARRRSGMWATEARVRDALEAGELVHVASHGILNPWNPMFSRIELYGDGEAPEDDGRLEVHEVVGMTIRSPLVFLSGCETGAGTAWSTHFARGEDYATLARAFLYAGATDVLATLWPVADRSAAVLTERFYHGLAGGASPAHALALAQRSMIRGPTRAAAYHWAPYRTAGANLPVQIR